ncbi:ROK family protein [Streptomyces nigrescens]|uniref:ROK family protein n=1 Tax=Streptomyces nigrescens TaxID=1920 RepID=UPI0036FE439A
MIRSEEAKTRSELVRASGLARATVAQRLTDLLEAGYIVYGAGGPGSASVGRPAEVFEFNRRSGIVLAADLDVSHCQVAATDLAADVLAETSGPIDMADGPHPVLEWVHKGFSAVLEQSGHPLTDVCGIALGLPGPVETTTGQFTSPTMMGEWHDFDIQEFFTDRFGDLPVFLEQDTNAMALGEQRREWPDTANLIMVKAGVSLGCGLVLNGQTFRGSLGAAGDIGHLPRGGDKVCRCGNIGCLETAAAGWALVQELQDRGREVHTTADVVALTHAGDPHAVALVRQAGRAIGEVVADLISVLNPSAVTVGGALADARETLLAGVREAVYSRSLPLATRDLQITYSRLGQRAGLIGAATQASEYLFAPEAVDASLSSRETAR